MNSIPVITTLIAFLTVFFISLFFEGVDRKVHARMQRRIGPPIIQPFYDFIKLFNKERIIPITASSEIFTAVPIIAAASSILAAAIPLTSLMVGESLVGDLILILYLLAMSSVLLMVGGSSSGNPYGAVGFSRNMTMLIAYEVPLFISIVVVSINCNSLAYCEIVQTQIRTGNLLALSRLSMAVSAIAFLFSLPAAAEVVPFDISEAKTEIVHGLLVEYSGPYLALFKLAKASSKFALTFLASTVFFYLPALFGEGASKGLGALCICLGIALILWMLIITFTRTIFARLKIGQALKFYWLIPLSTSVFSVALLIIGL
ncbi:MAG: complex I subunit 1 family protein [Candidatus Bathyarchaeia archaeon]